MPQGRLLAISAARGLQILQFSDAAAECRWRRTSWPLGNIVGRLLFALWTAQDQAYLRLVLVTDALSF